MRDWRKELEQTLFSGNAQQLRIAEILNQVEVEEGLNDDEKLSIETYARSLQVIPSPVEPHAEGKPAEQREDKSLFPRDYGFGADDDTEDGLKHFGFDETCSEVARTYATWLISTYLPTFHPMPNQAHQHKLAAIFCLLNCRAVLSKKQHIPLPYFLGRNGSGKTELGRTIDQHYPRHLRIEIRPNNTGASIRDSLDMLFGHTTEPCFALFDNLNAHTVIDRLGVHYDLILATNQETSISRVSRQSNDQGKSEYRTYCYKVVTSIFDMQMQGAEEFGEMHRRCITLKFQQAKCSDSREAYNWDGMQRVYQRVWGEENLKDIQEVYGKSLRSLSRIKPTSVPIEGKYWIYCQVPIAVGVYCGIFADVKEGIQYFSDHFAWLKASKGNVVGSVLGIVLTKYIKEELPALELASKGNRFIPRDRWISADRISQEQLIAHLAEKSSFAVSKTDMNELILIMNNFGYNYERFGSAMGFVKDVPQEAV
jgi:hypothetical protein